MSAPVSVAAARERAAKYFDKRRNTWAVARGALPTSGFELPLHPPAERAALADPRAVSQWIGAWDAAQPAVGQGRVVWEERHWASMGRQRVPVRLVLPSVADVARFARRLTEWEQARARVHMMQEVLPPRADAALARALPTVVGLDDADLDRLRQAVAWLVAHPDSGLYARQLPIRGVDTKWVAAHRGVVVGLVTAVTERTDLGLRKAPELVRVRQLDPAAPGLRDFAAPMAELARWQPVADTVIVVENLVSLLTLPPLPSAVGVHGSGYAVERLDALPWVRAARVLYWGDLDADGFAILGLARARLVAVKSVLMDRDAVRAYADLAVADPRPERAYSALTDEELAAAALLRELGGLRIEQERIPYADVVAALEWEVHNHGHGHGHGDPPPAACRG